MSTMYTINPKSEGIISWLLKYGYMIVTPERHRVGNDVCICLMKWDNGAVARVCYSPMELQDAINQCRKQMTTCKWFMVPTHVVKPFMHGQEIK